MGTKLAVPRRTGCTKGKMGKSLITILSILYALKGLSHHQALQQEPVEEAEAEAIHESPAVTGSPASQAQPEDLEVWMTSNSLTGSLNEQSKVSIRQCGRLRGCLGSAADL